MLSSCFSFSSFLLLSLRLHKTSIQDGFRSHSSLVWMDECVFEKIRILDFALYCLFVLFVVVFFPITFLWLAFFLLRLFVLVLFVCLSCLFSFVCCVCVFTWFDSSVCLFYLFTYFICVFVCLVVHLFVCLLADISFPTSFMHFFLHSFLPLSLLLPFLCKQTIHLTKTEQKKKKWQVPQTREFISSPACLSG